MSTGYCDLKAVLLCTGPGADPASFRPSRDDSQWWGRRDALVRCVSSFLFTPHLSQGSKELVFLFDDDLAEMTMKVSKNSSAIPTEQTVISLWKRAAQKLNTRVEANGMECCIKVEPTTPGSESSARLPTGLNSKREVLEHLQNNCSMDFLRSKGLNSNADVILRKTNKKALVALFNEWKKSQSRKPDDKVEALYSGLLKVSEKRSEDGKLVAATLHEMFQEFPCFGLNKSPHLSTRLSLVFFLGAVRDMSSSEHMILKRVCMRFRIPLLGVRFGTVPEFTSKILSVLAFHHFHNSIGVATSKLLTSNTGHRLLKAPTPTRKPHMYALSVVCTVPLLSTKVSIDLKDRCRIHWCLVRVIVCTLWRSRLVSSDFSLSNSASLHLIFDDGITVHLEGSEFVSRLANKHQAAPCEHQILVALKEKVKEVDPRGAAAPTKKSVASRILKQIIGSSCEAQTVILGIDSDASGNISHNFYSEHESNRSQGKNVILMLDVGKQSRQSLEKPRKIFRSFLKAAEKLDATFLTQSLLNEDCQDYEAATIIALQHFCYQNRLFVEELQQNNKRKRSNTG